MDRKEFDDLRRQMQAFPARQAVSIALVAAAVILLVWGGLSSYYTIDQDEVGVVQRFGRYTGTPADPGLHFKLPFGIDRVTPVPVDRVEKREFGFQTASTPTRGRTVYSSTGSEAILMLTADQNVVSVEWIVQFKIKDPVDYLFGINDPVGTLMDVAESTMRLVVGDSSATEALTARRQEIGLEVQEKLQELLDAYGSGIDVTTVELQNVIPPTTAVQDSFNEVNSARQDKETKINSAQREYEKAIPEAQGEARRLVQEAEGFKLKRVNGALGDVARFTKLLDEYEKSKDITRRRLYFEALEEVLPRLAQVYVVDAAEGGPLQVLDLEKALGANAVRSGTPSGTRPRSSSAAASASPARADGTGRRNR